MQTLYNLGLVGLVGFVLIAVFAVRGLLRMSWEGESSTARALLVVVGMQLVYYIPYGTDYIQQLILGTAISFVASQKLMAREATEPVPPVAKRRADWRWT